MELGESGEIKPDGKENTIVSFEQFLEKKEINLIQLILLTHLGVLALLQKKQKDNLTRMLCLFLNCQKMKIIHQKNLI